MSFSASALFGLALIATTSLPTSLPAEAKPSAPPGDPLVLYGRLIDGTGAPAVEDGVVVVKGKRIRCAGAASRCPVPDGAREIRIEGGTILPGLVDLHVHARPHYLSWFLEAGVTTIRDANNSLDMVASLLAHGPHRPRIVWSGPLLDGERAVLGGRGPFDGPMGDLFGVKVTTPEEARAAVDTLSRRGAEVVKLYEQLDPQVFRAAVERAREVGLPVMTDLGMPGTRGLSGAEVDALQAAGAGVRSLEHAGGYHLAYGRLGGDPRSLPYTPELIDRMARKTVKAGAAVVPTLSVFYAYADDVVEVEDLPAGRGIPREMLEFFQAGADRRTPESREASLLGYEMAAAVSHRVRELGGLVGAGSDAPAGVFNLPGGGLHRELELMVRTGATPLQAIHAATGAAGVILNREDLGVLIPGAVADILVVDGRPDEDVRDTRRIRMVFQGGRPLPLDALRARPLPEAEL